MDVALVESEFEVSPVTVELAVEPVTVELAVTPPDLYALDISPPPAVDLNITTTVANVVVAPAPNVTFNVGGSGGAADDVCYVPLGGAANQVLAKRSNADLDVWWHGAGNNTYHTPLDDLPPVYLLVAGDLWIDGDDNNATWRWDGAQWVDIHNLNIDDAYGAIEENASTINELNAAVRELTIHVSDVEKTSNTNDGRVSMSDYLPAPEDVFFPIITVDPDTLENEVTYRPRVEGSLWFQRTRPRKNLVTNPSFEKNANGWQATAATIARFDPVNVEVMAGTYCLKVTNTGDAHVETSYTFSCEEGKWYAASGHMLLVSGFGLGCWVMISFYDDALNVLLTVTGEHEDLVLGELEENWNRLNAVSQAPAGATSFRVHYHNPNPGDVWYLCGVIVENLDELGKYFDGDSYDGFWEGGTGNPLTNPDDNPKQGEQGWQESTSRLYGDKIIGVWELHAETWVRKYFTMDALGEIDAAKLTNIEALQLPDNTITTDKLSVGLVLSSEAMLKGNIVNIYEDVSGFRVRRASSVLNREASGFILDDVSANLPVRVYTDGTNNYQAGLTPGPQWLSDVDGLVSSTPPSTVGYLVQQVGFAADAFILNFHPISPVKLT